ncbi:hypothetical protein FXV77_06220 [Sphingobacterium phlebotomi]|uniref:Uncharacterized protein n=1 Tax=Sphingobacterium phlebotomi TaxID=2605433 RepID=A0A5D4HFI3_9SPHI|nr:hypothetical protein [Sphingobacterium phlebotomi]TYR37590.1 hypothetical protein FXV77_06220 [Sphingobacterium phlebotomi]
MLKPTNLTTLEIFLLIFTATLIASGVVIANIDINWYENVYAVEDGFVENWTIVPLLGAVGYSLYLFFTVSRDKTWHFRSVLVLIAVFSLFVAGEEISWGQRLFNVESPEFFKDNNAQGETNLHNMVVSGKKVNKIIFSQLLTVVLGVYLLVFPILYRKKHGFKKLIDRFGIPIAQPYQIIACLLLFMSILLIPSGKNAEVLEAGITTLFLLIFLFPRNIHIYKRKRGNKNAPIYNIMPNHE